MAKKVSLLIDAAIEKPQIALLDAERGDVLASLVLEDKFNLSEEILKMIDRLLADQGLNLSNLTAVKVNPGPGSYTSLRIAVTTANFLAFALNIPVLDEQDLLSKEANFCQFVVPKYYQSPVITRKRARL